MKLFIVLSVCVQLFLSANCALAPFITPCREKDSACLKTSAQKVVPVLAAGVPELELSPLDPMVVKMVKASQAGLDMEFRNTVVKGLRNCEVLNLKRNAKKLGLELKCSVTLIGNYTLGGQLLVMPIEGNGKYRIRIRDIIVKIQFEVQNTDINGETHWAMTTWRHTADVKTNVNFSFQNLFNGNKQLSDAIHEFANTSWRDIFQEVAPPIVKAIVSAVVEEVKKLFVKVPIKEMLLD